MYEWAEGFRGLHMGTMQNFQKVSCHNRLPYHGDKLKSL